MFERRLIDYLPPILREVREYKAIMDNAEQSEIEELWQATNNALDDQFLAKATENGISRWEKILNIVPQAGLKLDERRFTILARLNEQLPFTLTNLRQSLKNLCGDNGCTVTLNSSNYALSVKIALTAKKNYTDVELLLKRTVPANIKISLTLMYNQNSILKRFTHRALKAYTHHDLRNEVLTNGN